MPYYHFFLLRLWPAVYGYLVCTVMYMLPLMSYCVHKRNRRAAGLGAQPLYRVSATFLDDAGPQLQAQRRIGFRTFALVTGNDTDPSYVQRSLDADGTDTQGMLFRVNGAAVFSRGANMIPMEELEVRNVWLFGLLL